MPIPGFMQEKVQKGDFLKKPSRELKLFCCFRFLWISRRPGTLNWRWLVFLLSKILYKKCVSRQICEFYQILVYYTSHRVCHLLRQCLFNALIFCYFKLTVTRFTLWRLCVSQLTQASFLNTNKMLQNVFLYLYAEIAQCCQDLDVNLVIKVF